MTLWKWEINFLPVIRKNNFFFRIARLVKWRSPSVPTSPTPALKDRRGLTVATPLTDHCAAPVPRGTRATVGFASGTHAPETPALRECPATPSVRIHTSSVVPVLRYSCNGPGLFYNIMCFFYAFYIYFHDWLRLGYIRVKQWFTELEKVPEGLTPLTLHGLGQNTR